MLPIGSDPTPVRRAEQAFGLIDVNTAHGGIPVAPPGTGLGKDRFPEQRTAVGSDRRAMRAIAAADVPRRAERYASAALNAASPALPGTSSASESAFNGVATVFCAWCRSTGSSST